MSFCDFILNHCFLMILGLVGFFEVKMLLTKYEVAQLCLTNDCAKSCKRSIHGATIHY